MRRSTYMNGYKSNRSKRTPVPRLVDVRSLRIGGTIDKYIPLKVPGQNKQLYAYTSEFFDSSTGKLKDRYFHVRHCFFSDKENKDGSYTEILQPTTKGLCIPTSVAYKLINEIRRAIKELIPRETKDKGKSPDINVKLVESTLLPPSKKAKVIANNDSSNDD